jgi:hypothetical protein
MFETAFGGAIHEIELAMAEANNVNADDSEEAVPTGVARAGPHPVFCPFDVRREKVRSMSGVN